MKLIILRARYGFVIRCLSVIVLLFVIDGCSMHNTQRLNISYCLSEVVDGDSIFVITINGNKFTHSSSDGALEFFESEKGTAIRIRTSSGKGTFVGTGIDHYYFSDTDGKITYLFQLKVKLS